MADEPDSVVLQVLRAMRAENAARFDDIESVLRDVTGGLNDVRLNVASFDLRFDALDERVEMIREGTVTAIGYAASASRGHIELRKQIADLARRVEKLETRQ